VHVAELPLPPGEGCTQHPEEAFAHAQLGRSCVFRSHLQNFTVLYSLSDTGHSAKIGVSSATSVTARSLYGKFESTNTLPTDLDACNGHFGFTPDSPTTSVYHHHITDTPPFSFGCYGPSATNELVTLAECRSYYTTCGDDVTVIATTKGNISYDLYCPCYDKTTGSNVLTSETTGTPSQTSTYVSMSQTLSGTRTTTPSASNGSNTDLQVGSSSASSSIITSIDVPIALGLGVGLGGGILIILIAVVVTVYFKLCAPAPKVLKGPPMEPEPTAA
jgi:hypothetical protein